MNHDVAIVGAGPVGLCMARALALQGLAVALVERQPQAALADPAFDGREIALTHASVRLLRELDVWQRIPEDEAFPLRTARVMDRELPHELHVRPEAGDRLGDLVPNHLIRRAAWQAVRETAGIDLHASATVASIHAGADGARLQLADGTRLQARLLVAADSRYSETRRALGIGAELHDFGRAMLVCRIRHELPHGHAAWEWFGLGQTLALLPLSEQLAGAVVTLPGEQARALAAMDEAAFAADLQRRYGGRLGRIELASSRHVYPLVATWAHRFAGTRLALAGDAAVGMHPVTAHGYNFGLYGVDALVRAITPLHHAGRDIGDPGALARFDAEHRRTTLPIYLGTNAIVRLFTDDRAPARLLRGAVLRVADRLAPLKAGITRQLTGGASA